MRAEEVTKVALGLEESLVKKIIKGFPTFPLIQLLLAALAQ